ncbi:hypothetical protein [Klebsiella quasipneumoniae]|uniref:hypothetical protein n=1 Tax=Klebsiella quasipneumoniae TaxID=1463165 RepID=UPI001FCC6282|nr:hypothetical protein [Klebsiella quasipneumoniae]MCJ4881938.1 hypothetical protein [Klebsiella quasipneumoniae]
MALMDAYSGWIIPDSAIGIWRRALIKGSANFNNYRYGYWILCATSRTMNTNFAPRKSKERHTCRRNPNVITE